MYEYVPTTPSVGMKDRKNNEKFEKIVQLFNSVGIGCVIIHDDHNTQRDVPRAIL